MEGLDSRPAFEHFLVDRLPMKVIRVEFIEPGDEESRRSSVRWLDSKGGDKIVARMKERGCRLVSYSIYDCKEHYPYD